MAAILALRCIGTSLTVAGGGVGGLFIPLVVAGALAGRIVGGTVHALDTSLFTVIGVAAFLGAGYRVPLAGVMFVAEATGRPGFVVPGLIAAVVAELLMGRSSVTTYQRGSTNRNKRQRQRARGSMAHEPTEPRPPSNVSLLRSSEVRTMKRIVVGLDINPRSDTIVGWVERFAADTGVHVIVVHATPWTLLWVISSLQADFTRYLNKVRTELDHDVIERFHNKGISADLIVTCGNPAHELARTATRTDADMIVIGGADHSALHDVVFGGTARHLEHLTDVPVVVVPLKATSTHRAR